MPILSRTLTLDPTSAVAALGHAYLQFRFHPIEYSQGPTRATLDEIAVVEVGQETAAASYHATIPTSAIIGRSDASAGPFLEFLANHVTAYPDVSDIFSLRLAVQARSDEGRLLGDCGDIDAVYFMKGISSPIGEISHTVSHIISGRTEHARMSFVRDNLFLLNKDAYLALLAELRAILGSSDQHNFLLHLIAYNVDLSGERPTWRATTDADERAQQDDIFHRMEAQDPAAVLAAIEARFPALFDFPVTLDGLQLADVAGTLRIVGEDPGTITRAQIAAYSLSVEYTTRDEDDQEIEETVFYEWSASAGEPVDDAMKFRFGDLRPIVPATPHGPIAVFVKAPDGTILWQRVYKAGSPALAALNIEVPLVVPAAVQGPGGGPGGARRLRGRLLDLTGKATLKGAVIAIQAKKAGDADWRVVASGTADTAGNFSLPYPRGKYVAAQAAVSLTRQPVPVPVEMARGDDTIVDDFLYLMLEGAAPGPTKVDAGDDDCGCHEGGRTSRLPDHADLLASEEYSQDLGAGCVSLTTPNRTLSEYANHALVRTSDPDVANYRLARREDGGFVLLSEHTKIKRRAIDLHNPIRWQDAIDAGSELSFYQAVTVATGHLLHYKSVFKADGYSLGDLLYSLPLAPGQKKQIVIFDSKHTLEASESQQLSLSERLAANIQNDRSVLDQLTGRISETISGNSSANTAGVSVGLGVAASVGYASGSLGISGGYSNSESNAAQGGARDVSQFFQEKLRNSVMQNAESFRQQNASVVTAVSEGQQYSASTEVVANHNHCHAMTMMYFEVLRHYAVYQELSHVEECVFVPLLMTNFTAENIYKWQDVLAANLRPLPANTYLPAVDGKHPLLRAFDAIQRRRTDYKNVDYPDGAYNDEKNLWLRGRATLRIDLPRPQTRYDRIKSLPMMNKTITREEFDPEGAAKKAGLPTSIADVFKSIFSFGISTIVDSATASTTKTVSETVLARARVFDQYMQLDDNFESVPPAHCIRVKTFQPVKTMFWTLGLFLSGEDFFDGANLDRELWEAYAGILDMSVYDMLDTYFKGRLIAEWDQIFRDELAPVLYERLLASLRISGMMADFTSTGKYRGGEQRVTVDLAATTTLSRKEIGEQLKLWSALPQIKLLNSRIICTLEDLSVEYSTRHYNGVLFSGSVNDDLADEIVLHTPENLDERRNPRVEDAYLADRLIEHLNSNLEHYNKVLWLNLDEDRRYMLLDGFNIQIFNSRGVPIGLKSLASVIKNQLVAVVGNSLVLPVAAGFKVGRSYVIERTDTGGVEKVDLLEHYKPFTPVPPFRISVPTRGVFAEAVMGKCDACEDVKERSSQDWDKFRTDEPTAIGAITPPTATITDWKATFKELAAPLVAMQTAATAPNPGAGLAALAELLGKSDAFRDVTGLAKNQDNAMKTYESNQENARAFAEMAKGMAMQSHNTEHSEKIMDTLKSAKAGGALSGEEYGKLVKKHIDQQIDGGEATKQAAESKQAARPTVIDTAVKAAQDGRAVTAEEKDAKGNVKSVSIGKPKAKATPKPDAEDTTEGATGQKWWIKSLFFRAIDCYGDPIRARVGVYVHDARLGRDVAHEVFEHGFGVMQVPVSAAAPALQVRVVGSYQPDALTPILTEFNYPADPIVIPEAQTTINVVLKQSSFKKTVQTKESKLTAEKILDETSDKATIETSGKGGVKVSEAVSLEVNAKNASEIANKHAKEVSTSTGADEMNTFEITVPTSHYDLTVK